MVAPRDPDGPLIPQFFAGRSVFITGATGFLGKVLVERLLSTCPDIGCLFLLLREKKNVTPEKRLQLLKQSQVFDVVRAASPSQLDKLRALPGDTAEPQLGLTPGSIAQLQDVSVVFHSAATLKFDEALKTAVDQNVRSVMRLMEICDALPKIEAFVHVSTAYCNAELARVEERVYAAPAPPAQLLALVDAAPADLLAAITPQYIAPKPNTYTFTKAVAESVVESHGCRAYPIAIFRPTIVISAARDPLPGWIENLNGPSGVVVAAGKGLLHVFRFAPGARADLLPVDIAVDTLLATAWEIALDKPEEVRVYNCSTVENPTDWRQFEHHLRVYSRAHPMDAVFWYPSGISVRSAFGRQVAEFLLQSLPLHAAEYALRLLGIKPKISLITASSRMRAMGDVLTFFSLREWEFPNLNMQRLRDRLGPADSRLYNLDTRTISWPDLYRDFILGARKYLLQEKDQNIEKAKKHMNRMRLLHYGALALALAAAARLALHGALLRAALRYLLAALAALWRRVAA